MLAGPVYGARWAQRASCGGGGGGPVVQGGAKEGQVRLPRRGIQSTAAACGTAALWGRCMPSQRRAGGGCGSGLKGGRGRKAEKVFSSLQKHIFHSLQTLRFFNRLQKIWILDRLQNEFFVAYKKTGFR